MKIEKIKNTRKELASKKGEAQIEGDTKMNKEALRLFIIGIILGILIVLCWIGIIELLKTDWTIKYHLGLVLVMLIFEMGVLLGMEIESRYGNRKELEVKI